MAKLNACSASIQLTPSGNGLPSDWSQVGRFITGATTVLAALAGPSKLASTSMLELFTAPLFHLLQTAGFALNAAAIQLRQTAATNRAVCSRRSTRFAPQCTPAGTR